MATPPNKNTANSSSTTNENAIAAAANSAFIDQATQAINNAIAQGLFRVNMTTFPNVDLNYIQTYFQGLGYKVLYPDDVFVQPAQLFGPFFEDFFASPGAQGLSNPTEIIITWD